MVFPQWGIWGLVLKQPCSRPRSDGGWSWGAWMLPPSSNLSEDGDSQVPRKRRVQKEAPLCYLATRKAVCLGPASGPGTPACRLDEYSPFFLGTLSSGFVGWRSSSIFRGQFQPCHVAAYVWGLPEATPCPAQLLEGWSGARCASEQQGAPLEFLQKEECGHSNKRGSRSPDQLCKVIQSRYRKTLRHQDIQMHTLFLGVLHKWKFQSNCGQVVLQWWFLDTLLTPPLPERPVPPPLPSSSV
jgi:hypothetical protein